MHNTLLKLPGILLLVLIINSCEKDPRLPEVDFSFENNRDAPTTIDFSNNTRFADTYFWDFGDGNYSKGINPSNYYFVPGEYTVKLKAYNEEGSNYLEKTLTIRGTTYRVINNCPFPLINVIGFYLEGNIVTDLIGFGTISSLSVSSHTFTERDRIYLGSQLPDGNFFIISRPYLIYKDQNNQLEIHQYLEGHVQDGELFGF